MIRAHLETDTCSWTAKTAGRQTSSFTEAVSVSLAVAQLGPDYVTRCHNWRSNNETVKRLFFCFLTLRLLSKAQNICVAYA